MRDVTPEKYRCGLGQCPAVFDLGNGRYAVKGELIGVDGTEATVVFDPEMVLQALLVDRQAN
jgi:hypothetical protein